MSWFGDCCAMLTLPLQAPVNRVSVRALETHDPKIPGRIAQSRELIIKTLENP